MCLRLFFSEHCAAAVPHCRKVREIKPICLPTRHIKKYGPPHLMSVCDDPQFLYDLVFTPVDRASMCQSHLLYYLFAVGQGHLYQISTRRESLETDHTLRAG